MMWDITFQEKSDKETFTARVRAGSYERALELAYELRPYVGYNPVILSVSQIIC